MSLKDQLLQDMKDAMKEKAKLKLSVIRMVRSAIKNDEINKKIELDDEMVQEVVSRELKKRKESLVEYEKAGRPEEVEKLEEEIDVLMKYLPEQLTEEELQAIISGVIDEVKPESFKDQGKVMAKLMPLVKGKADGRLVSTIVKKTIEQKVTQ